MLSDRERAEIDEAVSGLPQKRAACIEALATVQRHRGWVDDEALGDVAVYLDMSSEEVEGVASFYNLIFRRPVGRHVILLCDSVSCWLKGCDRLKSALASRTGARSGEISRDGRFTVLPMACLGACDRAPALMVDEDLHGDVSPDGLDEILEGYG